MTELFLQILKFVSLIVGSVSGVIGTLKDTKDKETGRLTRAGRFIVFLLVTSGIIAVISQTLESYIQHKDSLVQQEKRREDNKRLESILQNAKRASEEASNTTSRLEDVVNRQEIQLKGQNRLFIQSSRLLTPLFPLDLQIRIGYPQNTKGFYYYLNWLKEEHSSPSNVILSIPVSRGDYDSPNEERNSREYPAKILTEPWVEIYVFREGNKNLSRPDLVLMGGIDNVSDYLRSTSTSSNYESDASFEFPVLFPERPIESTINLTNPLVSYDNGNIISFLDLNNATLIIDITNSRHYDGKLNWIEFQFKSGRRISNTIMVDENDLIEWKKKDDNREVYKLKLKANQSGVSRLEKK